MADKLTPKPVSMTTFVDFVLRSGTPKATIVKEWKHKEEYSPATDFYKPLRDALCDLHKEEFSPSALKAVVENAPPGKRTHYQEMANGYTKWLGKRRPVCRPPLKLLWQSSVGLEVNVNPELDLDFGSNERVLIKLYFKTEPLTKPRADIVLQLMLAALGKDLRPGRMMGILDVRKGKLFKTGSVVPLIRAQLTAEAAYWKELWPLV